MVRNRPLAVIALTAFDLRQLHRLRTTLASALKHASILDEEPIRILTTPRPDVAWVNASGMVEIQPVGDGGSGCVDWRWPARTASGAIFIIAQSLRGLATWPPGHLRASEVLSHPAMQVCFPHQIEELQLGLA